MARHSDASTAGEPSTLGELAELLGGTLEGDAEARVSGVARLEDAGREHLSFAVAQYRAHVERTDAAAIIVARGFEAPPGTRADLALIRVDNPRLAFALAVRHFHPAAPMERGIHPDASVDATAQLGDGVAVGACAVIGAGAVVGADTVIGAGCVVGDGAVIGTDCVLDPNVTVHSPVTIGDRVILHSGVVLGSDGFGFTIDAGAQVKIPQVGRVLVEDDVEIGANTCIDRATLGVTRVAKGAKIDNLVQIGHNCEVGEGTALSGQVGLGGSTVLGKGVLVGGQAGFRGHLSVGDGARIAGRSGVTGSISPGATVAGFPHLEARRWRRVVAALRQLPDVLRRISRLEAELANRKQDSKKEDA